MNSALKQEIMDAYRVGGAEIPAIARVYGVPEAQIEKLIFPHGRERKVLPIVLPKIAKDVTTLYGAEGIIRIPGGIRKLIPLSESRLKVIHRERVNGASVKESDRKAGTTPSKAKTPEGRLGALKAWETMRKQRAEAAGEIYIPRTIEELKILAGIIDDPKPVAQQPEKVVVVAKPEEVPVQPTVVFQPAPAPVVEQKKEDELDIDYKPIVEMGRVVDAYCKQYDITLKELLDSHQQLGLITKLITKT